MSDYILQTKGLTKTFRDQIAVNNVSISVRKNSVFGLLGPNGAGKSTILKMITGMMRPTSGEILFDGHPWNRNDICGIGALIENPAVYPNLTAMENLHIACILHGLPLSRAEEVLHITGLENCGKKKVRNFSLGMKQRLGLGTAIIHKPKLLILDEPTNGLDPIGIEELRELIKSFSSQGITVILSSHILSEVVKTADEVGIISNGELGYSGMISNSVDLEELFMKTCERNRGEN